MSDINFEYMGYKVKYEEFNEFFKIDLIEKGVSRNTMKEVIICIENWEKKKDEVKKGKRKQVEPKLVYLKQNWSNEFKKVWVTSKDSKRKDEYWTRDDEGKKEKVSEYDIFEASIKNIELIEKRKSLDKEADEIKFIKPDLKEFDVNEE